MTSIRLDAGPPGTLTDEVICLQADPVWATRGWAETPNSGQGEEYRKLGHRDTHVTAAKTEGFGSGA